MKQKNASDIRDQMSPKDIVILVEHCHSCDDERKGHNSQSLRHNPRLYFDKAKMLMREAARAIHACSLNARCGVVRMPITSSSRLGAFEVVVIYKDHSGHIHHEILASKLESSFWPNKDMVVKNLIDFICGQNIAKYGGDIDRSYNKSGSFPIGMIYFIEN